MTDKETPRSPKNTRLARTFLGESAAPIEQAGTSPLGTAITGITQTASAQALQQLNLSEHSPEQQILDIYFNLDRLHYYLASLEDYLTGKDLAYQSLYSAESGNAFNTLFENINLIATRLGLSFRTQAESVAVTAAFQKYQTENINPSEEKSYVQKYTAIELVQSLKNLVKGLEKQIEDHREDYDQKYPAQLTEEALDRSKVLSTDTAAFLSGVMPGKEPVYPGDIEYQDSEYDKLVDELDEMKNKTQLVKLFKLLYKNRSEMLLSDPEIRNQFTPREIKEFRLALYRTIANLTIGIIDAIPAGAGDTVSWAADISKVLKRLVYRYRITQKVFGKFIPEWADLTPDVSTFEAVMSELTELPTAGVIPSHLVFEFRRQFKADLPRLIAFLEKLSKVRAKMADQLEEGSITVLGLGNPEEKDLLAQLKAYQKLPDNQQLSE
jgi:hypothetical protein